MTRGSAYNGFSIALLVVGSAISLISCGGESKPSETNDEKIISRTVRDMEVLSSNNGLKKNLMRAPLMENHAFANPSFEEFREGIEAIGYDSLGLNPASRIVADHALHWVDRDLWQLSGNVVVDGEEGQKLYTQQLFWDVKTHKIWSNVDSKIEDNGAVTTGTGFEALDDFGYIALRNADGTVLMDVEPTTPVADSTGVGSGSPMPPDPADVPTLPAAPVPSGSSTPAGVPTPGARAGAAATSAAPATHRAMTPVPDSLTLRP